MIKKNTLLCFLSLFTFQLTIASIAIEDEKKIDYSINTEHNHSNALLKTINLNENKISPFSDLEEPYRISSNTEKYNPDFSFESIEKWYPIPDPVIKNRDLADTSFKKIEKNDSWVDNFSNEDIQELPVGVKHSGTDGVEYAIGITKATFNKDYTELNVFARLRLPKTDAKGAPLELFFGANNVKLSHKGGIIGEANLALLGDLHIPFNAGKWMLSLKGGFDYTTGETKNLTYVTITCGGVKDLSIQGIVEFSRELLLPVEKDGSVNLNKTMVNETIENEKGTQTIQVPYRVKGAFNAAKTNWNNILVSVDLQPFVLTKKRNKKDYKGNFQFAVNKAVLDFSDIENDSAVQFPDYYHDNELLIPNEKSWRGIYVNSVEVKMPAEFMTSKSISGGNKERVGFGAHNLIIDNYGVSGDFYGDAVFPLDEGRTNKSKAWAYSLDHIEVSLAANNFIKAEFDGRILLPVSKKQENSSPDKIGLSYSGLISPEEYRLTVRNDSTIDFNLWKAKGQLQENSEIVLAVKDNQFKPKATLHGLLAVSASQVESLDNKGKELETGNLNEDGSPEKKLVEFKGIVFNNLILQTESPVFQVDYMGYQGDVSLAGFPVSISDMGIRSNDNKADLYFNLAVNLMGENNGFSGETSLSILGEFKEENYKQKWNFKGVNLNSMSIDADLGGFAIWGSLDLMNNDPIYGDGFAATLGAKFRGLETEVEVNAIFGKTTFRYWMVDAMVDLPPGVGTGTINLSGFAGGASYRMRRQDFSSSITGGAFTYKPDKDTGLGVKAMILLNVIDDSVLKGGAGFEILFNNKGGINQLGLYAQTSMMNVKIPGLDNIASSLNKFNENASVKAKFLGYDDDAIGDSFVGKNILDKAENETIQLPHGDLTISTKLGITFDFQNNSLDGILETFVNTPGGFIKGRGVNGRSGWAKLHISKEAWYLYLGTPSDPQGFKIGIGSARLETGGYFMVGSVLEDSPPPPQLVADILGVDAAKLNYMRDENALKSGKGFAFGQKIEIDTGDLRFLIFYANFQAAAGYDIMLRNYGEAACSNTGKQVGINGWYANGQAYAALQGELGINIKLFFVKKKIPIIKGAAAVLLQAKGPNPIWMRGYVGGNFNLLGGLVKGRFRFKVTIGKQCIFENAAPLGGLKIIADVTPKTGSDDIDVFAIPQASFSMKIGEPIVIPEDNGDNTYRVDLEKFTMLHNGIEIPGTLEWSTYKDRANFVSDDILPPNDEITVQVEVSFKQKINGVFRPIIIDGKKAIEIEERVFTTGGAPNYIPLTNVTYAYPVVDQKYFLEDEYNKGYIQLKRGQDYLFNDTAWESFVNYKEENGKTIDDINFNYSTSDNVLSYPLPNVNQEAKYTMQIASRIKGSKTTKMSKKANQTDAKSVKVKQSSGDDIEKTSYEIAKLEADNLSQDGQIERLAYNFGTSKYKTFKKKINTINTLEHSYISRTYPDVIELSNSINTHEPFDITDLVGTIYSHYKPLVTIEASLDDNYFNQDINPSLYSKYPLGNTYTFKRDLKTLGSPPKKAIELTTSYLYSLVNDVDHETTKTYFPFKYNLGLAYKLDWDDMKHQIINDQIDGLISPNNTALSFLDKKFLFMRHGYYNTTLQYKLPGGIMGTSTNYAFKNTDKTR